MDAPIGVRQWVTAARGWYIRRNGIWTDQSHSVRGRIPIRRSARHPVGGALSTYPGVTCVRGRGSYPGVTCVRGRGSRPIAVVYSTTRRLFVLVSKVSVMCCDREDMQPIMNTA